jgi:enoyl-CoA hydratase/carnithine racemase
MLMSEPVLLTDRAGGIATLTLNRPHARNALSQALLGALADALTTLAQDRATKVIVLAANGPVFSAGHDLKEMRANPDHAFQAALFRQCSDLMLQLTRQPQPIIARVHGMATAAGCQLVATTDLAIAGRSARFATPGVDIGLFCSTPMVALTRAIGAKPALEMLYTGQPIDADEAARVGLITRAVADSDLDQAVHDLATRIASKSRRTLSIGKEAFWRQRDLPLDQAYDYAAAVMAANMVTPAAAEGIDAFIGKRPPCWPE